jgi:hypothetical protein
VSIIVIICVVVLSLFGCEDFFRKIFEKIEEKLEEYITYDEFKEEVDNYSVTIEFTDDGVESTWIIKVCEDGFLYDNGSSINFLNAEEKKVYFLNKTNKTGSYYTDEEGDYDWESQCGIEILLFPHELVMLLLEKGEADEVADRSCVIYTYEADNKTYKYWLDDEYGLCLKYEISENDTITNTMEVTDFSVDTVTLENIIDLSEYTITDGGAYAGEE